MLSQPIITASSQFTQDNVVIQDLIITAMAFNSKGEYGYPLADENSQVLRLFLAIKNLMDIAAFEHRKANCHEDGSIREDKVNHITRLVTQENTFYTKKPLNLLDFKTLHTLLLLDAQNNPENFHSVLSSFAVKTKNKKIMNVVAHVVGGKNAKINLTVKNNCHYSDPVYIKITDKGSKVFENIDINKGHIVESYVVDGCDIPFSFNNVFESKTQGGIVFKTCIDICYDHYFGVAKRNLTEQFQKSHLENSQNKDKRVACSHIVTSNTIPIIPPNAMGMITHADPWHSTGYKANISVAQWYLLPYFGFGVTPLSLAIMSPAPCSELLLEDLTPAPVSNTAALSPVASSPLPSSPNFMPAFANYSGNQPVLACPPLLASNDSAGILRI